MIRKVTIIICTRNRMASLRRTLARMRELRIPHGWMVELLVVDNGSTDETSILLQEWRGRTDLTLRPLCEPRGGKSVALNRALGESRGDVLLFTDDDVLPPLDWVEPMSSPLFAREADAIAGGIRLGEEFCLEWLTPEQRLWLAHTEGVAPGTPLPLIGANMAIGRWVFERLGGFDEEVGPGAIGHAEDILFWLRVRDAGMRVKSLVEVEAVHHPGTDRLSWKEYSRQARKRGEFAAYVEHHYEGVVRKHPYFGAFKAWLKLWLLRCQNIREWAGCKMMPAWELNPLEEYHMRRHLLRERRRPRNYDQHRPVEYRPIQPSCGGSALELVSRPSLSVDGKSSCASY